MIKASVYTESLSPDFGRALAMASQLSLEHVDLRSVYGHSILEITAEEVKRIKNQLKNSSIKLSCLASPVFKSCFLDDEDTYWIQLKGFHRMVKVCKELDVHMMRIFCFAKPNSQHWDERPDLDIYLDRLVDKLDKPVKLAEENGIILVLETEGECYNGTSEETLRLIRALNNKTVKICWDVLNAWISGEEAFPSGYNHVRSLIAHVHAKDSAIDPKTKKTRLCDRRILGKGDLPWKEILEQLHRDGYNGLVVAERFWQNDSAEQSPQCKEEIFEEVNTLRKLLEPYNT